MSIKPLGGRILVKQSVDADEIIDGVVIPEMAKERPLEGEVMAIGTNMTSNIKEGDIVLIPRYGGIEARVDGEICYLIKETDIIASLNRQNCSIPA